MYRRLVKANIDKDIDALKEVCKYLEDLRDTWEKISHDRIMLLLDEILKNFDAYDGSPEAGMELIQANQLAFDSLRELVGEGASLDSQYLDKLELIIEKQNTLVEVLKKEKEDLLGKLEQINTKEKLVNSYLSPEVKPVFIDKDM